MFVLNVIGKGAEPGILRGLGSGPATILSPGMAFDLPVTGTDALAQARERCTGFALDINLLAPENRRKKLLVADMDSTIINVECLDELADMAGLKHRGRHHRTRHARRAGIRSRAAGTRRHAEGAEARRAGKAPMPNGCG